MIALRGSVTSGQSSSNQTPALGAGFQAGDCHVIWQAVKSSATSQVAPTPSGYTDAVTIAGTAGTILRVCLLPLAGGETAPTLSQSGETVFYASATFSGVLMDTASNIIAATTPQTAINSSSTQIGYASHGLPSENGVLTLLFGVHCNPDGATFGSPTTLTDAPILLADTVGLDMHGVLWQELQVTANNNPAGNIPMTGATVQTNRSAILTLRAQPTAVIGGGRMMMTGAG